MKRYKGWVIAAQPDLEAFKEIGLLTFITDEAFLRYIPKSRYRSAVIYIQDDPELEEDVADPQEHDWGDDSYRCLRCGCNRDNAPDQACKY